MATQRGRMARSLVSVRSYRALVVRIDTGIFSTRLSEFRFISLVCIDDSKIKVRQDVTGTDWRNCFTLHGGSCTGRTTHQDDSCGACRGLVPLIMVECRVLEDREAMSKAVRQD